MTELRKTQKTGKDEGRMFRALVRLERPGGGYVEPGETCVLGEERAAVLLDLGLITPSEEKPENEPQPPFGREGGTK